MIHLIVIEGTFPESFSKIRPFYFPGRFSQIWPLYTELWLKNLIFDDFRPKNDKKSQGPPRVKKIIAYFCELSDSESEKAKYI